MCSAASDSPVGAAWLRRAVASLESAESVELDAKDLDSAMAVGLLRRVKFFADMYVNCGVGTPNVAVAIGSLTCLVCGADVRQRPRSLLFCSLACSDVAICVRLFRKKIASETLWDHPTLAGAGQSISFWVSSGVPYSALGRRVPRVVKLAVYERDGGTCQLCGKAATQIDHINGSSPDPANLRAVCSECNRQEALAAWRPVSDPSAAQERASRLAEYIASPLPLTAAFDHSTWNDGWRTHQAARRALLRISS